MQNAEKSPALHENLFHNDHTIMLLSDPGTGAIVAANPAACAFYGYSREEFCSLNIADLNGPPAGESRRKPGRANSGATQRLSCRHRLANGDLRHVEVRSGPADVEGRRLLFSVIQDITGRVRTEEALTERTQDLQRRVQDLETIFATAPIGLAIVEDAAGKHIRGNPASERMLGVPQGTNLSKAGRKAPRYRVLQDGTELPLEQLPMQRAIHGETVSGQTVDIIREDGQAITLHCSAAPLYDEEGRPRGAVGAFLDLTDHKRARAEADEAKRILDALMEYIPEGITIADAQGMRLGMISRYGQEALGFDHQGMSVDDVTRHTSVFHRDGLTPMATGELPLTRAIVNGETIRDEEIVQENSRGDRLYLLCNAAPIRGAGGDITGGIVAWRDITERKRMEESLQRANEQLEKRVRERTRELAVTIENLQEEITERVKAETALQMEVGERLRAMEALREKEQLLLHQGRLAAMGEMLANIAHQWRQPLNTLGLLIQDLSLCFELEDLSQDDLDITVAKAMQVISHMSRTIDDFRHFFRPDKEKVEFVASRVVADTISLVEGSFRAADIDISVETTGEPVIYGYPNEFSQVLINILLNARDALLSRNPAVPRITVSIGARGGRTVVTIRDNGGGIPDEILDRIFDPYFTTKGPDKGTGLGLFMSKTIIEKNMGGSLRVSNTGEGAEFRIEA